MPSLADTIAHLSKLRRTAGTMPADAGGTAKLAELEAFGTNPGALRARIHVPADVTGDLPLVVVLHGCTQTADGYDAGAGWSQLADRHGFAVLFPEQQRSNNANLCFNWFSPADNRRGQGEALSIRQMIDAMADRFGIDPARVYVTGLSAGGAMATVMLATYPDVFAGGAIIAGLAYGCAGTVPQAFERMQGNGMPAAADLAALVRDASPHAGPWPTVSVWHGSGDAVVNPANAGAIVAQWRALHEVGPQPSRVEAVDGYPRRVWTDERGREVIEEYSITGMGHGTPLDTSHVDGCGRSGPYMLEASISSTARICRFWGLAGDRPTRDHGDGAATALAVRPPATRTPVAEVAPRPRVRAARRVEPATGATNGVGKVIEDALRAAGLMR